MITQSNIIKKLIGWELIVAAVLMIPFLTNAPWTGSDYVFAGIVLSLCATVYVMTTNGKSQIRDRLAIGVAILFFIFLVIGWAATGP